MAANQPNEKVRLTGFGVANYRSFDAEGFLLQEPGRINVLLGQNNCGKSNVLRFLRHMAAHAGKGALGRGGAAWHSYHDSHQGSGGEPTLRFAISIDGPVFHPILKNVYFRWPVLIEVASRGWMRREEIQPTHNIPTILQAHDAIRFANHIAKLREANYSYERASSPDQARMFVARELFLWAQTQFEDWHTSLIYVPDFRRIRRSEEQADATAKVQALGVEVLSGERVIERLYDMQHPPAEQSDRQEEFLRIQGLVAELLGVPELRLEVSKDRYELLLTLADGKRRSLESFGSGVHQLVVLCVGFALYSKRPICIEEPETNLHPALQRRFLQFLASRTDNRYFITTHSNVFIDLKPNVRVYHVRHDGQRSKLSSVDASQQAREVLADLGYLASDLLQANCVIWVEGPSDRIYLNRWIRLFDPDLVERLHYAIFFYGGANLAHVSAAADDPLEDFISLLHLNRNATIVIDRDGETALGRMTAAKLRLQTELPPERCWITQGREIENYLSPTALSRFLSSRVTPPNDAPRPVSFGENERIDAALARSLKAARRPKLTYSREKVRYAREIVEHLTREDLERFDLRERTEELASFIRMCNAVERPGPPTGPLE